MGSFNHREMRSGPQPWLSQCYLRQRLVMVDSINMWLKWLTDFYLSSLQVRIFPYLIGRESAFAENLKWMACANKGGDPTHSWTLWMFCSNAQKSAFSLMFQSSLLGTLTSSYEAAKEFFIFILMDGGMGLPAFPSFFLTSHHSSVSLLLTRSFPPPPIFSCCDNNIFFSCACTLASWWRHYGCRKWHDVWFSWDSFFCCIYMSFMLSQTCAGLLSLAFQASRCILDVISWHWSHLMEVLLQNRLHPGSRWFLQHGTFAGLDGTLLASQRNELSSLSLLNRLLHSDFHISRRAGERNGISPCAEPSQGDRPGTWHGVDRGLHR